MHRPTVLRGPSRRAHFASRLPLQNKNRRTRKTEPKRFRADLVARVRAEIALGTYETHEKLEVALARLLEDASGR